MHNLASGDTHVNLGVNTKIREFCIGIVMQNVGGDRITLEGGHCVIIGLSLRLTNRRFSLAAL